ncbi:MAG TPA: ABC transporter permease [Actinophytocola sp.]|jgi:ABC-2 type transport system permease protein|uniref:ABC transporter permease n=1 Tax=Actinophytocola sp. TaxID=1872138 RepID=UPI002F95FC42
MTEQPNVRLGSWSAVSLVAGREVNTRLRSKAFLITTAATLVLLIGASLVFKLIGGGSDATVGFTEQNAALAQPFKAVASSIGQNVDTKTVPSEEAGRDQVADQSIDALVVGDGTNVRVVVKKDLDDNLRNAFNVLAGQVVLNQEITKLGGDPAQVNSAVANAKVDVEELEEPYPYDPQQLVLGIIAGILIYMSLLLNGQMVAQGVVEEKSSRVVELLLSTIRPWQLMAGKVLGIGLVGLIQMVVIGGVGVATALALDVLTISATAAVGTVVWLVVWYLLGFLMYSLVFAALGALVSRQEDVGGVISPALMFVIVGYVIGISVLPSDPDNTLVETLSIIPVFAPTMMPMRLAMGGVPVWEAVVSVGLVVALIPALVWLAGKIYANAVMRSGARVKLSDALRQV